MTGRVRILLLTAGSLIVAAICGEGPWPPM